MPRRIVTILEGESLVNDATALVALSAADRGDHRDRQPSGRSAGTSSAPPAAACWSASRWPRCSRSIRRRIDDPVLDTTLSFIAPFVAYLPAEAIHASGVLAVVVTGLLLGHKAPHAAVGGVAAGRARPTGAPSQFLLENAVFLLIGLQVPADPRGVATATSARGRIVLVCGGRAASRRSWCASSACCPRPALYRHRRRRAMRRRAWTWRAAIVVSWAGMRGVVTLAAAFLLPEETPHREVLLLAAFVVVAGTLLIQGTDAAVAGRAASAAGPGPGRGRAAGGGAASASRHAAGLARLEEVRAPTTTRTT